MKRLYLILTLLCFSSGSLLLTGCQEDDSPVQTQTDPIETQATEDAADLIAESVGGDNGGINDQLTDIDQILMDFKDPGGGKIALSEETNKADSEGSYTRTFNESDTTWIVYVTRSYTNSILNIEGEWTRGYNVWFKKEGEKKKYPRDIFGNIVVDQVYFSFIADSCTGIYQDIFIYHELKNLEGSWVGDINLNDSTMTVNTRDTYQRAALDTLRFGEAQRTSDHSLTCELENVKYKLFKRPLRLNRPDARKRVQPISGKISGEYNAFITFKLGEIEDERTVKRTFVVDYGEGSSTGTAKIKVTDSDGRTIERETNVQTGKVVK